MIRFRLYALALAVTLALPATACSKQPLPLSAAAAAQETLARINQYRQSRNQIPLELDEKLAALAQEHNLAMRRAGRLSHDNFQQRFDQSGRMMCVENVAWNALTPAAIVEDWRNSAGHNANMLNSQIRNAGVAIDAPYATFFACD